MQKHISNRMTPLSIWCVAFGFNMLQLYHTNLKQLMTAYCTALTVVTSFAWTLSFLLKLFSLQHFTFVSVLCLVLDVTIISIITYTRVKYMTDKHVFSDIIDSISYADYHLTCLGVSVPHARNHIVCTVYTVVVLCFAAIKSFIVFRPQDKVRWTNLVADNLRLLSVTVKIVNFFSGVLCLAQFTFLLFMIKQRLRLIRHATDKIEKYDKRKIAWENSVDVPVVQNLRHP